MCAAGAVRLNAMDCAATDTCSEHVAGVCVPCADGLLLDFVAGTAVDCVACRGARLVIVVCVHQRQCSC